MGVSEKEISPDRVVAFRGRKMGMGLIFRIVIFENSIPDIYEVKVFFYYIH